MSWKSKTDLTLIKLNSVFDYTPWNSSRCISKFESDGEIKIKP